jgi:hypothetical protein
MARHHFLFTLLALVVMTALLARAQDVAAQPEDSVALASTDASPAAEALGKEAVDAVAAACALAQNCSQCKVHATPHHTTPHHTTPHHTALPLLRSFRVDRSALLCACWRQLEQRSECGWCGESDSKGTCIPCTEKDCKKPDSCKAKYYTHNLCPSVRCAPSPPHSCSAVEIRSGDAELHVFNTQHRRSTMCC